MIKATCEFVTATGSERLLLFSTFMRGNNLHRYSWNSVGHLSKHFDANDVSAEEHGATT